MITVKKVPTFYKSINTAFVNDKKISLKAKGILIYLLSKPDDWKAQIFDIAQNSIDGEKSIRSGLKELVLAGYAKLEAKPKVEGQFQGKHYIVSDEKKNFENP